MFWNYSGTALVRVTEKTVSLIWLKSLQTAARLNCLRYRSLDPKLQSLLTLQPGLLPQPDGPEPKQGSGHHQQHRPQSQIKPNKILHI
jgi:hypothetical protein